MSGISTHILDTAKGHPAAGVRVHLFRENLLINSATTNPDGRIPALLPATKELQVGIYKLQFDISEYSPDAFYPEVHVVFRVNDAAGHYHVPLLLSPFGYSTYRGS